MALADPALRPVLTFPVRPEFRFAAHHATGANLGALLGLSRAAVLRCTLTGGTTAALAELNNLSAATISHHTGVLRNAGLITTHRHANTANHLITPLGLRLLDQCHTTPTHPTNTPPVP
ncbi:ArsR/SmtB family transcription factor [Umezawaea beigongshangensis]|uniref:ArsR/SmtB family transcription factor n=1 Tax=Umezawaea beigongshangensis TaxID=2780383 RepID=UPI0018F1EB3A|nr:helix-turn-helix domain-containing protein [Umezawaea beigongshangensis]